MVWNRIKVDDRVINMATSENVFYFLLSLDPFDEMKTIKPNGFVD